MNQQKNSAKGEKISGAELTSETLPKEKDLKENQIYNKEGERKLGPEQTKELSKLQGKITHEDTNQSGKSTEHKNQYQRVNVDNSQEVPHIVKNHIKQGTGTVINHEGQSEKIEHNVSEKHQRVNVDNSQEVPHIVKNHIKQGTGKVIDHEESEQSGQHEGLKPNMRIIKDDDQAEGKGSHTKSMESVVGNDKLKTGAIIGKQMENNQQTNANHSKKTNQNESQHQRVNGNNSQEVPHVVKNHIRQETGKEVDHEESGQHQRVNLDNSQEVPHVIKNHIKQGTGKVIDHEEQSGQYEGLKPNMRILKDDGKQGSQLTKEVPLHETKEHTRQETKAKL